MTVLMMMMMAIIIICVIMFCFSTSAGLVIQILYGKELLTAKLSNSTIMVMDTAVTVALLF